MREVWRVGDLVAAVAGVVGEAFGACTVQGEIGNWSRAGSGHCYFALKDADGGAQIRCAMFRRASQFLDFAPVDGVAVEIRGRIAVYEPRGELQFVVEAMRRAGAGALYERFLRLKARLEAEGLFDTGRKRALPAHPRRIGIVTSLAGAALHDVATALARRSPQVQAIVYPSPVQGIDAPAALVAAIETASRRSEVELLIVCRGGGSLEDLWAFNDERVVRAIRSASMPVVVGVGHETDTTLADLAADCRAPTPTAAAEIVAPEAARALAALDRAGAALRRSLGLAVERRRERLAVARGALVRRVAVVLDRQGERLDRAQLQLARPSHAVAARRHRLDALEARLRAAPVRRLAALASLLDRLAERRRAATAAALARLGYRLGTLDARLGALDPARALARGYALLVDERGALVGGVASTRPGMRIEARLADGRLDLSVEAVRPAASGTPR
jgi:exodeoxyribonuclease VII large subunit